MKITLNNAMARILRVRVKVKPGARKLICTHAQGYNNRHPLGNVRNENKQ